MQVIGYHLSPNLQTNGSVKALRMALQARTNQSQKLIHHSDCGIQYFPHQYTRILKQEGIRKSMTEGGNPGQNAIAEQLNGILKTEFALKKIFEDLNQAETAVASAIFRYNHLRPHCSCDYLTPAQAHQKSGILRRRWPRKHKGKIR